MSEIIFLTIGFVTRTAVLTLLLWIMIRFQKLNYNFPGLLGSAALASALDMITYSGFGLGHYLALPVLYLCIWKVTGASLMPDAIFTVVVAYALMFAVKMLLLTALMPDIHPLADPDRLEPRLAMAMTNHPRVFPAVPLAAAVTNHPAATSAPAATPTKSADDWLKDVAVKGATENGSKSMLIISVNKKTYTLVMDDPTLVQMAGGSCQIRLISVSAPWATVEVNGEAAYLRIP